ncbi:MAG: SRPBCC family protein [Acidobacteriota bacterium]|nr:SRPBCC family protein [Acidobacteriota bacterium]
MITRWRFKASPDEVYTILSDPLEYSRWWPSVYLMVRQIGPGRVTLHTRGWLPYTLWWAAETTEKRPPSRIAIQATGDFRGKGEWSIVPDGEFTDVTFDWRLNAEKPLLRYLTFLLRPAFEANHRWAMEQGRRSLELELARYRANTAEEMNAVPAPPCGAGVMRREVFAGTILAIAVTAAILKGPR